METIPTSTNALDLALPREHPRKLPWWEPALVVVLALAILIPGIGAYTLVDPWETHYAEVARRMLQDNDLVHTKWQNEGFRSKPVLTFWLIAASLKTFGYATGGGFSGEMVSQAQVIFAVRLPFVLFAVLGVSLIWWMLARLISRRTAWLAYAVLLTTPFYFLIARQAITDMPLVGCLMGAMACFAMATHSGNVPLRRLGKWGNGYHVFVATLILFVGWQIAYYAYSFTVSPQIAILFPHPNLVVPSSMAIVLLLFLLWGVGSSQRCWRQPTTTYQQLYMYWFFFFLGISVLAKGPPAIGLAAAICLFYTLLTRSWKQLGKLEIPRGVLICVSIAVPWHVCMWLRAGRPFLIDYFLNHMWRRAATGVHGDRGTFDYFLSQIGIGMWPWSGIVPMAIIGLVSTLQPNNQSGRVRILVGIWAICGVALFSAVQTKFHHYIFPAVPALAICVALFLEDIWTQRIRYTRLLALVAIATLLLITRDFIGEHKQLIELFVYRYNRPWPDGPPWNIDLSVPLGIWGGGFAFLFGLLSFRSIRIYVLGAIFIACFAFAYWTMHVYMVHAGQHWGQRSAIATYYQKRRIHGIDLRYYGIRQLTDEWHPPPQEYRIDSYIPETLALTQQMAVHIEVLERNKVAHTLSLYGTVSRIGTNHFWIQLSPESQEQVAALAIEGTNAPQNRRQSPWKQVNADRLLAWQLYWRGENFWTGDEIWGQTEDTQTAFKNTDNKAFLAYLNRPEAKARRYFVITESGRIRSLQRILPSRAAKHTFRVLNTDSNKFTLASFDLD